ncbi:MAG: transcription antitermination factor NusB [Spirochaetales bacterium]|nr:transcription antitermination factor NusB [Spirochaetales bacterium]
MGSRRKGRIIAFQTLYRFEITREPIESLLDFSWMNPEKLKKYSGEILDFVSLIVSETVKKIEDIDDTIKRHLKRWDISRLNKVDLALLRMSVYCLLFQKDIPATVTIDEAVDIAKDFGTDDSYKFINGILDNIRKEL